MQPSEVDHLLNHLHGAPAFFQWDMAPFYTYQNGVDFRDVLNVFIGIDILIHGASGNVMFGMVVMSREGFVRINGWDQWGIYPIYPNVEKGIWNLYLDVPRRKLVIGE